MAFLLKISVLAIAVTMALTITITMKAIPEVEPKLKPDNGPDHEPNTASTEPEPVLVPSKRVSRFLAANNVGTNPRAAPQAADHCKNDNDICNVLGGRCCQNKCIDVSTDKNNCGACKNKCKFTHTCCRGQCVLTAFDKRHCGRCNNGCRNGKLCVYGMCNYG